MKIDTNTHGVVFTIKELTFELQEGIFDHDGWGYWSPGGAEYDELNRVLPLDLILDFNPPVWAKQIIWFSGELAR
jgi:hypothetical protein